MALRSEEGGSVGSIILSILLALPSIYEPKYTTPAMPPVQIDPHPSPKPEK